MPYTHQAIGEVPTSSKLNYLKRAEAILPQDLARVPSYFDLSHEQLLSLIRPETLDLWNQAKKSTSSYDQDLLIEELQKQVYLDIMSSDLTLTPDQLECWNVCNSGEIIVRSASIEDRKDKPNAGVNKTVDHVAPELESMKEAVAQVLASYFNRILLEDETISIPLCTVIVMRQITEENGQPITSGVMMSSKPSWGEGFCHIVSSFGFGAGVSTKVTCDEFVCVDDTIYQSIRPKYTRVLSDKFVANIEPNITSLSNTLIEKLQIIARILEKELGQPADIEFVISSDDKIWITQLRPYNDPSLSSSPTFIDPSLPENAKVIQGHTILAGESKALTLFEKDDYLVVTTLNEAESLYHAQKLVITAVDEQSNSHDAVNIVSHRPPVSCISVTVPEEFEAIRRATVNLHACPQTGRIILTNSPISIRKGLYQHPCALPISLQNSIKTLQGVSNHPLIVQILIYLNALPEEVIEHIDTIEQLYTEMFREISERNMLIYKTTLDLLQTAVDRELKIIKQTRNNPTKVSFHSGILRQLTQQNNAAIGGHSLSGVESITQIEPEIQTFILSHNPELASLAFLARHAFDDQTRDRYLAYLVELKKEERSNLLSRLQKLDETNLLSSWLSFYFSIDTTVDISSSVSESFCPAFNTRIKLLSEQVAKIDSEEAFSNLWGNIEELTQGFFLSLPQERSHFDRFIIKNTFEILINLWDGAIKRIPHIHSFSKEKREEMWHKHVTLFEKMAAEAGNKNLVDRKTMSLVAWNNSWKWKPNDKEYCRPFDVSRWLFPYPNLDAYDKLQTYNERLSVLHQNLIILNTYAGYSPIPASFQKAIDFFDQVVSIKHKHTNRTNSWSVKYESLCIKISKHFPLNIHSANVEIGQKKNSSEFHIDFEIKRSDNWQSQHISALKVLSYLYPQIQLIERYASEGDLKVELIAPDLESINIIAVCINNILKLTLYLNVDLYAVFSEDLASPSKERDYQVLSALWHVYVQTKDAYCLDYLCNKSKLLLEQLKTEPDLLFNWATANGLLSEILTYIESPPPFSSVQFKRLAELLQK